MASSVNNSAWLNWMAGLVGGVSRQSCSATLPPNRFHCLLDELPLHLIPRPKRAVLNLSNDEPLFLNPQCTVCSPGQLPDECAPFEQTLSAFARDRTIAWVRDAATGSLLPFWLGPKLEPAVRSLNRHQPAPSTLANDARRLLYQAGILVAADPATTRAWEWEAMVARAAPLFQKSGYAPLGDLIHPFHVAALRRYYRYLIRTGAIALGDRQSSRRYAIYNDPVARFFHRQIATTLSAVAAQPLKPSYVYLASYLSGAELNKHTDREQCEFSVTLCLDFSPEPALASPWPIQLDTTSGNVKVYQALGDGLAYRGTRLPHYRLPLGEGQTSTSIFFHYVAEDFAGSLD